MSNAFWRVFLQEVQGAINDMRRRGDVPSVTELRLEAELRLIVGNPVDESC